MSPAVAGAVSLRVRLLQFGARIPLLVHRVVPLCVSLCVAPSLAYSASEQVDQREAALPAATTTPLQDETVWSLDALLAAPQIEQVLASGKAQRVSVESEGGTLSAIASAATEGGQRRLRLGPLWVARTGAALPHIDPLLRRAAFGAFERTAPGGPWRAVPLIDGEFPRMNSPHNGPDPRCVEPPLVEELEEFRALPIASSFQSVASTHALALEGLCLAHRLTDACTQAPASEPTALVTETASANEAAKSSIRAMGQRWLETMLVTGLPSVPPYGNPLVAWIELSDARQCLLRALGRVKEADAIMSSLTQQLARGGWHDLSARLTERVPVATEGFASCTFHPCWLIDTGEISAGGVKIWREHMRFVADLKAEVRRTDPCDPALVDAIGTELKLLVGTLPLGVRVDDEMRGMLMERVDGACSKSQNSPMHPQILRSTGMTIALAAWTTAWTAEGAQSASDIDARIAWRARMLEEALKLLEPALLAMEFPDSERQPIIDRVAELLASTLNRRDEYLGAFPPGPQAVTEFRRYFFPLVERYNPSLVQGLLEVLDPPAPLPNETAEETFAALQIWQRQRTQRRNDIANVIFSDVAEALFMACCESRPEKDYPEPFTMQWGGFTSVARRTGWSITRYQADDP